MREHDHNWTAVPAADPETELEQVNGKIDNASTIVDAEATTTVVKGESSETTGPLWQPLLLLLVVQSVFAGNALLGRWALQEGADPIVFSFTRDMLTALVMLAATFASGTWRAPASGGEAVRITLLGVAGVCGGQALFVIALLYVSPATVTLCQLLQTVLMPVVAAGVGLEPLFQGRLRTALRLGGLLVCVFGAMGDMAASTKGGGSMIGFAILGLQIGCGVSYQVLMKILLVRGWPPIALVTLAYSVGACGLALMLPLAAEGAWALHGSTIAFLIYAVLFTSAFNYSAMAWVNRRLGPIVIGAFFPVQPVLTALGQPVLGLGWPTSADLLAAVIVFSGLAMFLAGEALRTDGKSQE